jgi:hypothetical protein
MKSAMKARQSESGTGNDDAMDIDGETTSSFKTSGKATFGAYKHENVEKLFAEYPLLETRLKVVTNNGDGDKDALRYRNIYQMLALSEFNYDNVYSLSKRYGIQLFRLNYWRPFQQYQTLHMIAMVSGPQTMVTGFASPLVHPSMQGMEGYINIIAQYFSALIVTQPKNVRLIANVIMQGLRMDINTSCITGRDDFMSNAPHKPSVVPEVVPLDETQYQFPLHYMGYDIYHPNDANARSPFSKHSGRDLLVEYAGRDYLNAMFTAASEGDPMTAIPMSLIGFRSWVLHYDKKIGRYNIIPGTGPRGRSSFNAVESAAVYAGDAVRFPSNPHYTVATTA